MKPGIDPKTGQPTHGFETKRQARKEDIKRIKLLKADIKQIREELVSGDNKDGQPLIDLNEARGLRKSLRKGVRTCNPEPLLGSSSYMRDVRLNVVGGILQSVEHYPISQLNIVTVLNEQWKYDPVELNNVTASSIKRQFRTHLNRIGVLSIPGFLIGFLHGEFEPTSSKYQLHYHVLTTSQKANKLVELIGKLGYVTTETGSNPIVRVSVRDRPRQFSYLLKAYWPEKPVVIINGIPKRTRTRRRIKGIYHSQVLLWLSRQSLNDLMLLNGIIYRGHRMYLK